MAVARFSDGRIPQHDTPHRFNAYIDGQETAAGRTQAFIYTDEYRDNLFLDGFNQEKQDLDEVIRAYNAEDLRNALGE